MSASVRLMIQGHSARRVTSRVRQCHQLIKNLGDFSESYTNRAAECSFEFETAEFAVRGLECSESTARAARGRASTVGGRVATARDRGPREDGTPRPRLALGAV